MFLKKQAHRVAVILIAAILTAQFNVTSYGAETGSFGSERLSDRDSSVSEPVIHFTVPAKPAEPAPETSDYHSMFSTQVYKPMQIPMSAPEADPAPGSEVNPAKEAIQNTVALPGSEPAPEQVPAEEPEAYDGQEQTPIPEAIPQPEQGPAINITPVPSPTPAPEGKEDTESEIEKKMSDDEGIPEGTPERIRELIRQGRLRAVGEDAQENSLSSNTAQGDSLSSNNIQENGLSSNRTRLMSTLMAAGSTGALGAASVSVTGVEIHPHGSVEMGITKDTNFIATYVISPSDATNQSVTWSTSNPSVATVESNGKVNFKGEGTVKITVRTVDGGYTDSFTAYVTFMKPKGVTLKPKPLEIYEGETGYINAYVEPENLLDQYKGVTWTLPNTPYADLSYSGSKCTVKAKTLNGVNEGRFTVSVRTVNGGFTDTCDVIVKKKKPVTGVLIKQAQGKTSIYDGEYIDLTAEVTPNDAYDKSIKWTKEPAASDVATISDITTATGPPTVRVRGQEPGDITIRATAQSGVSATYRITVNPVPVDSIELTTSPSPLEIAKGQEGEITVRLRSTTGYTPSNTKVTWTCSDTTKVTLSKTTTNNSGETVKVTGVDVTDTPVTITARSNYDRNKFATCQVTVTRPIDVSGFRVNPDNLELQLGDSSYKTVNAVIEPRDATNQTVTWAIVEGGSSAGISGSATGKSCRVVSKTISGNALLRATLVDGDNTYTADCNINVVPRKVSSITLNPTSIDMDEAVPSSLTKTLTATVYPTNAANKNVIWTVGDENIVSLTGTGLTRTVKGLKPGETTVTATTEDGGFSKTCIVKIKRKPIALNGLIIDPTNKKIKRGSSFPLYWELDPVDADCDSVTLSGYDPEMITVEKTGDNEATVSGSNVGNTQITVTARNGNVSYTQTCSVTVEWINVTSVALSCDEIFMVEGETRNLNATVYPTGAEDTSVSWNSAAPSIASVDQSGLVTAVSEGTTVVTVITNDGGHKAVCAVHVRRPGTDVDGITVTPSENTINIGQKFTAEAIISPDEATDKTVIWRSNNPAVAIVSGNGLTASITAKAVGSAVISATASNGMTAFCIVNVDKGIVHVTEVLIPMYETIYTGQSASLPATVTPDDADDKTLIWTSSDEDIVSVNSAGRITGKKEGKATVRATAADGGAWSECLVTVTDLPKPTPEKYRVTPVDERANAYHPEMELAAVESLEGDRYLVIFDSDGAALKRLIRGDTTLSYTRAIFCDMWLVDAEGHPKDDFIRCTSRIPLPPEMDIHKGTVRVVTMRGSSLDKSIPSSVGEENGVAYVTFTTTHFTEYAILYKENKKEDPKVVTKTEYRDVPVVQYVQTPEKKSQPQAKPATSRPVITQPAPIQTQPAVTTRILDSVPRTGDTGQ